VLLLRQCGGEVRVEGVGPERRDVELAGQDLEVGEDVRDGLLEAIADGPGTTSAVGCCASPAFSWLSAWSRDSWVAVAVFWANCCSWPLRMKA